MRNYNKIKREKNVKFREKKTRNTHTQILYGDMPLLLDLGGFGLLIVRPIPLVVGQALWGVVTRAILVKF